MNNQSIKNHINLLSPLFTHCTLGNILPCAYCACLYCGKDENTIDRSALAVMLCENKSYSPQNHALCITGVKIVLTNKETKLRCVKLIHLRVTLLRIIYRSNFQLQESWGLCVVCFFYTFTLFTNKITAALVSFWRCCDLVGEGEVKSRCSNPLCMGGCWILKGKNQTSEVGQHFTLIVYSFMFRGWRLFFFLYTRCCGGFTAPHT